MTQMVNARINRDLYDWLEGEAERCDDTLSEAIRRQLWIARLSAEIARHRSDAALGVQGADRLADELEQLVAAIRSGDTSPTDDTQATEERWPVDQAPRLEDVI